MRRAGDAAAADQSQSEPCHLGIMAQARAGRNMRRVSAAFLPLRDRAWVRASGGRGMSGVANPDPHPYLLHKDFRPFVASIIKMMVKTLRLDTAAYLFMFIVLLLTYVPIAGGLIVGCFLLF